MMPLAYLATPYTNFHLGHEAAWEEACRITASLCATGIAVYSPIVHGHAMCRVSDIDRTDTTFWYPLNAPFMAACRALIVAHMPGWDQSEGIAKEIKIFREAGKPIFDLDPKRLRMDRQR